MYVMKPILVPAVIDAVNKGRFDGDLEGYVLSDGGDLFGWILFRREGKVTYLLDFLAPDSMYMDGLIRVAADYGRQRGAEAFSLNPDIPGFAKYKEVFFENEGDVIPNEKLFTPCGE